MPRRRHLVAAAASRRRALVAARSTAATSSSPHAPPPRRMPSRSATIPPAFATDGRSSSRSTAFGSMLSRSASSRLRTPPHTRRRLHRRALPRARRRSTSPPRLRTAAFTATASPLAYRPRPKLPPLTAMPPHSLLFMHVSRLCTATRLVHRLAIVRRRHADLTSRRARRSRVGRPLARGAASIAAAGAHHASRLRSEPGAAALRRHRV